MRRLSLVALVLSVAACGGDSTGPSEQPAGHGDLEVTLVRAAGAPQLLFSASVKAGTGTPTLLRDGRAELFSHLPAGTISLEASGLTTNCSVQGQNPRSVSVVADQVTQVNIQVICSFSPDPRLVFVWREKDWDLLIWTANPDGTDPRQLTSHSGTSPEWSPDGTRILYSEASQIMMMNYDGTERRKISDRGGLGVWSGDGSRILYTYKESEISNAFREIWAMNSDGSDPGQIGKAAGDRLMPAWSHDSQKIAFCEDGKLTVMNADGTTPTALTVDIGCSYPAWSPDDQEIAFGSGGQISKIAPNGSDHTLLTDVDGGAACAGYSPDGTAIFFHSGHGSPEPAERVWVMDVDGENQRYFDAIPWVGAQYMRLWEG